MPIVRLEMLSGRSQEQLEELAEVLTRETARITRCKTADVQVVISEVERSRWSIDGKLGKPTTTPS